MREFSFTTIGKILRDLVNEDPPIKISRPTIIRMEKKGYFGLKMKRTPGGWRVVDKSDEAVVKQIIREA